MKYTMYTVAQLVLNAIILDAGIDRPDNYEDIISYMVKDMKETADPEDFHSGDARIAFRRFLESKTS